MVIRTGLDLLISILLDSIVELRNIIEMMFTDIARTLKIGTVDLASFRHALNRQSLEFVCKQDCFVLNFVVTILFNNTKLTQVLRMGGSCLKLSQLIVEICNPLVIDSEASKP